MCVPLRGSGLAITAAIRIETVKRPLNCMIDEYDEVIVLFRL